MILSVGCTLAYDVLSPTANFTFNILANRDPFQHLADEGIRLTPEQIVSAAVAEDVHCVGLSILSGSHMELVPAVLDGLREAGLADVPVIVGGIIPDSDGRRLKELGVAAVYTPKDF
eukprot:gene16944-20719_t